MSRIILPPGTESIQCHCGTVTMTMAAYAALPRGQQFAHEQAIRDCARCRQEWISHRRPS